MSLDIKMPGDSLGKKQKLSKFGKIIITLAFILVGVVVAIIVSLSFSNAKMKEKEIAVNEAVHHSIAVVESSMTVSKPSKEEEDKILSIIEKIESEKDILSKINYATDAINVALGYSKDKDLTYELNGARNRILYAMEQYKNFKK